MSTENWIGYRWLAQHYGIDTVQPYPIESQIGATRRRSTHDGMIRETYPQIFRPEAIHEALRQRMEPTRVTEERLIAIQAELSAREPIFHRPEFGSTRAAFESMTDADFWEVGASGRRYSRASVLNILDDRYAKPMDESWETRDFFCQEIAVDTYLLTYTLLQDSRVTRRATLWRRSCAGWKIVYHQGTIVQSP